MINLINKVHKVSPARAFFLTISCLDEKSFFRKCVLIALILSLENLLHIPVINSSGDALCVELWPKPFLNRILAPMLDISFGELLFFVSKCNFGGTGLLKFVLSRKIHFFHHLRNQGRMQIFAKITPEGFKSRFDTVKFQISSRPSGIFGKFWKRYNFCKVNTCYIAEKEFRSQCHILLWIIQHEYHFPY